MGAITDNLRRLTQFGGRESRASFWPYAGVVLALAMTIMFATMMPDMIAIFSAAAAGGDRGIRPDFSLLFTGVNVAFVLSVSLLAAAVTRRLHDTGKRGWWGLLPVPFIVTGMVLTPLVFAARDPDFSTFGLLFLNNALYLLALLALAVLLALPSQPGTNRFGPPADSQ